MSKHVHQLPEHGHPFPRQKPRAGALSAAPALQAPAAGSLLQRAALAPASLRPTELLQLQRTLGNRAIGGLLSRSSSQRPLIQAKLTVNAPGDEFEQEAAQRKGGPDEEEFLQGKFEPIQREGGPDEEKLLQGKLESIQRKGPQVEELPITTASPSAPAQLHPETTSTKNNTGLPDKLKAGIEQLSGISMDGVKVHYHSSQPAQINALAYTRGTDIHIAPGQEQHLPHEAWHVVQQAQGRVKPTMQMKDGVPVNDDEGLEHEADVMGAAVLGNAAKNKDAPKEQASLQGQVAPVIQRAGHAEDLCVLKEWIIKRADVTEIDQYTKNQIPGTAPTKLGPFYTKDDVTNKLAEMEVNLTTKQDEKVAEMAKDTRPGGRGFMLLANATAGMTKPALRDLKLGKHTASGTDQERHGITGASKSIKILQHDFMDWFSGSQELGFRDEDQWKASWTGNNLIELDRMLDQAEPEALKQISSDLDELLTWLEKTKVVYVGMSVLIVVDQRPGGTGKAMPIDFEHPIWDTDLSFNTHKEGMETGVRNMKKYVGETRLRKVAKQIPRLPTELEIEMGYYRKLLGYF